MVLEKKLEILDKMVKKNYVQRWIGIFTSAGIQSKSIKLFFQILKGLKKKEMSIRPINNFFYITGKVVPLVKIEGRRVSGKVYGVPKYLDQRKAVYIGMHWILEIAREQQHATFTQRVLKELLEIKGNSGKVLKRNHDLHLEAMSKKAHLIYF
jgi:ribosomal protein S7